MTRPMNNQEMVRRLRREAKAALRLGPLVLASLLLAAIVWRADSAAISGTFQSSIIGTPTVPAPVDTATPVPTSTATGQPTAPFPPGTATAEPTAPAPSETPTLIPTEASAEPSATAMPTEPPPADTPSPTPTSAEATVEPTPDDKQRYPDGETDLKFEWGMLFDSVSLLLSYIWLFCGVLVFLTVPILFIVLWVASKRRQQQQE
jgi:outer membrane biosynthesis protein TonB